MAIAIHCPKCRRIIGDTETSIKANINCKNCGKQSINIVVVDHSDYLRKESNDKSEQRNRN